MLQKGLPDVMNVNLFAESGSLLRVNLAKLDYYQRELTA